MVFDRECFVTMTRHLPKAGQHPQACDHHLSLAVRQEGRHVAPGHQPHGQQVLGNRVVRHQVEEPEVDPTAPALEPVAPPLLLHAIDDVDVASRGVERGRKRGQQLGVLLQVRIDQEDELAASMTEPRHHRPVMAEVPGEIDHSDARVAFDQFQRDAQRAVRRAVVDEDNLEVSGDRLRRGARATVELLEVRRRIVERGDDGEGHGLKLNINLAARGPSLKSRSRIDTK